MAPTRTGAQTYQCPCAAASNHPSTYASEADRLGTPIGTHKTPPAARKPYIGHQDQEQPRNIPGHPSTHQHGRKGGQAPMHRYVQAHMRLCAPATIRPDDRACGRIIAINTVGVSGRLEAPPCFRQTLDRGNPAHAAGWGRLRQAVPPGHSPQRGDGRLFGQHAAPMLATEAPVTPPAPYRGRAPPNRPGKPACTQHRPGRPGIPAARGPNAPPAHGPTNNPRHPTPLTQAHDAACQTDLRPEHR